MNTQIYIGPFIEVPHIISELNRPKKISALDGAQFPTDYKFDPRTGEMLKSIGTNTSKKREIFSLDSFGIEVPLFEARFCVPNCTVFIYQGDLVSKFEPDTLSTTDLSGIDVKSQFERFVKFIKPHLLTITTQGFKYEIKWGVVNFKF